MPVFFFNDTATTEIYTLSLHDALPILTEADAEVADFARRHLQGKDSRSALRLAEAINGAVSYLSGATEVTTTASDALKLGKRSEEHTSELQSRNISYAVFCLKKKKLRQ